MRRRGGGDWGREADPAEPSSSHAFDGGSDGDDDDGGGGGGGWHQAAMKAGAGKGSSSSSSSGDSLWQWRSQGLSEVVLSWSVDQILNKDLLRDKVTPPPPLARDIRSLLLLLLFLSNSHRWHSREWPLSGVDLTKCVSISRHRLGGTWGRFFFPLL